MRLIVSLIVSVLALAGQPAAAQVVPPGYGAPSGYSAPPGYGAPPGFRAPPVVGTPPAFGTPPAPAPAPVPAPQPVIAPAPVIAPSPVITPPSPFPAPRPFPAASPRPVLAPPQVIAPAPAPASRPVFGPAPGPPPAISTPPVYGAPHHLGFLQQRLAAIAASNSGEYGMAAMDLSTGETVSFNGQIPFPMASVVKVAVAATYLSQVDAGRRSLDDAGPNGVTARVLMERMITRSDNAATDQLFAMLGGPQVVDGWLRRNGFTGMRVDRTIAQLLAATRDLRDIRDSATPLAFLRLMQVLDNGRLLSPRSRAHLMDVMARCITGSNRIRGLLPRGTRVEHKTGTLTGLTDDVAFVTLPDGRRIIIIMFARYGDNRPATIASASLVIYETFVARGGASAGVPAFAPAPARAMRATPAPFTMRRLPVERVD